MQDITLGTIYEDVAALQEQVTRLQGEMIQAQGRIAGLQAIVLTGSPDLDALSENED